MRTILFALFVIAFVPPAFAQAPDIGWTVVSGGTGEIGATINSTTVLRDKAGNAHAMVCLYQNGRCISPLRWFFNCTDHSYSAIDTTVTPQLPHEMNGAQPGSVADKLATIACASDVATANTQGGHK